MKRLFALILVMLLLLSACGKDPVESDDENPVTPPEEEQTAIPREEPEELEMPPEAEPTLAEELQGIWSRIDGSTATIPLSEGLFTYFSPGKDMEIQHNKTHNAYENLFSGECDIIFVTYPSEAELEAMQGGEFEVIPVVKDAFVLLVNTDNPIDSLTKAQLQDIYTGDITDWSEVGGNPGHILPYQRPENSGSQTLFLKLLMEDKVPMLPPVNMVPDDMGGLVDVVGLYDDSKYALGYSVFYYAAGMYGNDRIKLLGVDGVVPSKETITNGEYPLETFYYAVLRKDTPTDAPARKLLAFLLSEEGQIIAESAGYVPLYQLSGVGQHKLFEGSTTESSGTGGKEYIGGLPPEGALLSDLFYDDVNYITYINEALKKRFAPLQDYMDNEGSYLGGGNYSDFYFKRPFMGIPHDYSKYTIDKWGDFEIIFEQDNPYLILYEQDSMLRINIGIPDEMTPYDFRGASDYTQPIGMLQISKRTDLGIDYYVPIFNPNSPDNDIDRELALFYSSNLEGKQKAELETIDTYLTGSLFTAAIRFTNGETVSIRANIDGQKLIGAKELFDSRYSWALEFWKDATDTTIEALGGPVVEGVDPFDYAYRSYYGSEEALSEPENPKEGYVILNVWEEYQFMVVETMDPDGTKGIYRFTTWFGQALVGG